MAAPTQAMLINPKVYITIGGEDVAVIKRGEIARVPLAADAEVTCTSSIREVTFSVRAGRVTRVQLAWDRISGKLVAQEVDAFTGGTLL